MNTLRLQCPATSREVDSGISPHRSFRLVSIRARCPICQNLHEWQVADGSLGTVLAADHRSNGARAECASGFQGLNTEILELREQLLDELNHRLKNNLQIVYGFLQAACRKTDNAEAREVLSDTTRRIGAMGTAQQVFTLSAIQPMSAGKNSSKLSVPMPETSLARKYRSTTKRPPGLCRKRRRCRSRSF
jgi:two-component sensor histidine kinase